MSYRIWDEEPATCISALVTLEEHEHSVLTRRRPGPISPATAICQEHECDTSAAPESFQREFHTWENASDTHISKRNNF